MAEFVVTKHLGLVEENGFYSTRMSGSACSYLKENFGVVVRLGLVQGAQQDHGDLGGQVYYTCTILASVLYLHYCTALQVYYTCTIALHRGRYLFRQMNILRTIIWLHLVFSAYHI